MKRKRIILIAVLLFTAFAGLRYFRLEIIRAAIKLPLPGWIFNILWGW